MILLAGARAALRSRAFLVVTGLLALIVPPSAVATSTLSSARISATTQRPLGFPLNRLAAEQPSASVRARGETLGELETRGLLLVDRSGPRAAVNVLARLRDSEGAAALRAAGFHVQGQVGPIVSLAVEVDRLSVLAAHSAVVAVEPRRPYHLRLDVNTVENGASLVRSVLGNGSFSGATGRGVVVAVIDSGIDWTHEDFRNPDGSTRIKFIWDMLDTSFQALGLGSAPPITDIGGNPIGTVYSEADINSALAAFDASGARTGIVNSVDLVGHGTHVAGIAAGNGRATGNGEPADVYVGIAPEADLLVVRAGGTDKFDTSFAGDLIAALEWIETRAQVLGQPYVVNMSLGSHIGAHDGTDPLEVAIDSSVRSGIPGKAVVVAAGNEATDDIHAQGALVENGDSAPVTFTQTEETLYNCWIDGSDAAAVETATRPTVCEGVFGLEPFNGDLFYLLSCPGALEAEFFFTASSPITVGTFHCWAAGGDGHFTGSSAVVTHLVGMPGTARNAITVGAHTARVEWPSLAGPIGPLPWELGDIAFFSSPGPTRDGRTKPDLTAGGFFVLSTWSTAEGTGSGIGDDDGQPPFQPDDSGIASDGVHVASQGTSMATPQVSGAVALLLEADPALDAAELKALLMSTTRRDALTGPVPNATWGAGKLDVKAAVDRATSGFTVPLGSLENPHEDASGIILLSGWVCDAEEVRIVVDGTRHIAAAYGTSRTDTKDNCGDTDNGFGVLWNANLFGDGEHTAEAFADGVPFGSKTFTVTTLGGQEFVEDLTGEFVLNGFPSTGRETTVRWNEPRQNFMITRISGGPSATAASGSPLPVPEASSTPPVGALGNPQDVASGILLFSGWVCEAEEVKIVVDGTRQIVAAYGTARADTKDICDDTDNGFGVLWNANLFGDGEHTAEAWADGVPFDSKTFTVTTIDGDEFVKDLAGEFVLSDFPTTGEQVTVRWNEEAQNFVIVGFSSPLATCGTGLVETPCGCIPQSGDCCPDNDHFCQDGQCFECGGDFWCDVDDEGLFCCPDGIVCGGAFPVCCPSGCCTTDFPVCCAGFCCPSDSPVCGPLPLTCSSALAQERSPVRGRVSGLPADRAPHQ